MEGGEQKNEAGRTEKPTAPVQSVRDLPGPYHPGRGTPLPPYDIFFGPKSLPINLAVCASSFPLVAGILRKTSYLLNKIQGFRSAGGIRPASSPRIRM